MAAELARADGRIGEEEVRVLQRFVHEVLLVSGELEARGAQVFREARERQLGFDWYALIFVDRFVKEPSILFSVLHLLFDIAEIDGVISPAEEGCLAYLAAEMDVTEQRFKSMLANKAARGSGWNIGSNSWSREQPPQSSKGAQETPHSDNSLDPLSQAYSILNCSPKMALRDIKDRYRRLVKKKHPDTLLGKHVTPERRRAAADEFQRIQDAFDLIREHKTD
jgi:DnaJ like chaperone protein